MSAAMSATAAGNVYFTGGSFREKDVCMENYVFFTSLSIAETIDRA
jgi:hypothetical protein